MASQKKGNLSFDASPSVEAWTSLNISSPVSDFRPWSVDEGALDYLVYPKMNPQTTEGRIHEPIQTGLHLCPWRLAQCRDLEACHSPARGRGICRPGARPAGSRCKRQTPRGLFQTPA